MSFASLLNRTAEVWRAAPTQDYAGQLDERPALVGSIACTLSISLGGARTTADAERPGQQATLFAAAGADVAMEDILVFRAAPPAAVAAWRVVSPPDFPREHHLEAMVEAWDGEVPES